jgi:hypothetical protein
MAIAGANPSYYQRAVGEMGNETRERCGRKSGASPLDTSAQGPGGKRLGPRWVCVGAELHHAARSGAFPMDPTARKRVLGWPDGIQALFSDWVI